MNTHEPTLSYYVTYWIFSAFAFILTSKIIKGFEVNGFFSALVSALFFAFVNSLIWPLLMFLTLPINILTLGLFTFVVNGAILKIVAAFMPGFRIQGWFSAIIGSLCLSLLNIIFQHYINIYFNHPVAI